MRYLLFNLVVFAALAYLITGDGADPQSWFEEKIQNLDAGAWLEQRRDAPQTVATPVTTPVTTPAPAPALAPQIAPQPVDTIADKTEAVSPPPPVHEAPLPAPVAAEAAPPVAEPRDTAAPAAPAASVAYDAPVIAEAPASTQQTEQPAFMTRPERRRELNRLIQDMEGQFLDRLGE